MRRWSNGATYSAEQVQAARNFAAQVERDLIGSIESGDTVCNDPDEWVEELDRAVIQILDGSSDHNFTIWQRMNTYLTGECVPLLAPRAA